jgi:type II secretory pathway component GspD/PulD (secretin)
MEIWQEVSRIDQSIPGLSDVVTVKRQISTVISAQDGETIAIGGLKNEQQELGISKVPFLGDLPVIGSIFRQEVSNSVSRNLAIFLRPTLVNNPEQREKILKIWKKKLAPGLSDVATDKTRFFENKSIADRMPETPLTKKDQAPLQ